MSLAYCSLRTFLIFIAAALSVEDVLGETPRTAPNEPLSVETPWYAAWVQAETSCCPKSLKLGVQKDDAGETVLLELTGRMEEIEELQPVAEQRLLLVGELRYGGTSLWIANVESLEQEAEIWTYGYGLSPSKRFLVYETHYPRLALPVESRRSIVLLYDLTRSPAQNRSGAPADWPEPNLGAPVFPKENVERRSWRVLEAEHEYSVTSPFLWSHDETMLVFLAMRFDENHANRQSLIVRVDLTREGNVSGILQEPVSLENLDPRQATVPLAKLSESPILVNLDSLSWVEGEEGSWATGETSLPGDQLGTKVRIRVPGPS